MLWLQWRGIVIVIILLVDVIFFSVVFVYLDDFETSLNNYSRVEPWLICLAESGGDKSKCYALGAKLLISESTVVAVLILLSLSGIELFVMLFRWSIITGWKQLIISKLSTKREFVSLDALPPDQRARTGHGGSYKTENNHKSRGRHDKSGVFELQEPKDIEQQHLCLDTKHASPITAGTASLVPLQEAYHSPLRLSRALTPDSTAPLNHEISPNNEASRHTTETLGSGVQDVPRSPRSTHGTEWNPRSSFVNARTRLGILSSFDTDTETECVDSGMEV